MTNQANGKKQLPAAVVLALIALVSALALALTNAITAGPIREREMKAQREAFGAVMMADEYRTPDGADLDALGVSSLVEARTGNQLTGWCAAAIGKGYASDVAVTLGVDANGQITGVKIGDGNFAETAGFGSRWLDEKNWAQFEGIDVTEGGMIEALSGATVTSKAVLDGANKALAAINAVRGVDRSEPVLAFGVVEKAPVEKVTLTGDVKEGVARGFQSDVKVQLTLDDAGLISALVIDSANETAGFGTRCGEDADFAAQFIGKAAPVALGEGIDALSGATVTSKAVVEAVNNAVTAPASADAVPTEAPFAPMVLTGDIKEGVARGFQSDVKVQLTTDDAGAITGLVIDSASETMGFGTRCGEDAAFVAQFIGKTAPVTVDALSGATVTSKAVMDAVNAALAPAAETEENAPVAEPTAGPAGETYEGTAKGFQSDVKVAVTVDNGVITALTVDSTGETTGFGTRCGEDAAFLAQFVGKTAPVTVDALSGATVTSKAVMDAVNAAMPVAEVPAGETYEATAKGFQSDVKVAVTVDNGVITALTVDSTGETAGFGTRCGEDAAFLAQFIGKTVPVTVDALSGATVTSKAVMEAVNAAIPAPAAPAEPAARTLTVPGYQGLDVVVTVTRNADGTIATLTVNADTQSPGLGKKCAEDGYLAQFIGKTGPFALGENVDAVSYATITSQAIIDAVNAMLD